MALKSIRLVPYDAKLHVNIVVEFENVVGGLRSAVRPFGFSVCENGKPVHSFYGTVLDGNRAILRTTVFPAYLLDRQLHFGSAPILPAILPMDPGAPCRCLGRCEWAAVGCSRHLCARFA